MNVKLEDSFHWVLSAKGCGSAAEYDPRVTDLVGGRIKIKRLVVQEPRDKGNVPDPEAMRTLSSYDTDVR